MGGATSPLPVTERSGKTGGYLPSPSSPLLSGRKAPAAATAYSPYCPLPSSQLPRFSQLNSLAQGKEGT